MMARLQMPTAMVCGTMPGISGGIPAQKRAEFLSVVLKISAREIGVRIFSLQAALRDRLSVYYNFD